MRDPFAAGHLLSIVDNREVPRQTVEFTIAALPGSREIAAAAERVATTLGPMSQRTPGYLPLGLSTLRREIADLYAQRGLPTEPEQIIVTSGAQQAIALVAQLFRGSRVAMEDPTNPASLDAFRAAGAEIGAIAVDGDGARVDDLERIPAGERPRAIYVATTFNNPTGTALSLARRQRLAALAIAEGWTIIEDETLCGAGVLDRIGVQALLGRAAHRLGARERRSRQPARAAEDRRRSGHLARRSGVVRRVAAAARRRAARTSRATARALRRADRRARTFVAVVDVERAARRFVALDRAAVRREGVTLAAGGAFSSTERHARRLRLPFVLDPDVLRLGVERLARVWEAYAPRVTTLPLDAVV
jgi:DNA-binding transcriptional MocR family regulator